MTRGRTLEPSAPTTTFVTEWATDAPTPPTRRTSLSSLTEPRFTCASCGGDIRGPATFHVGVPFCCAGCVAGGPCTCSYDLEPGIVAGVPRP